MTNFYTNAKSVIRIPNSEIRNRAIIALTLQTYKRQAFYNAISGIVA